MPKMKLDQLLVSSFVTQLEGELKLKGAGFTNFAQCGTPPISQKCFTNFQQCGTPPVSQGC